MKKMLITGGSHSELPLIEVARSSGWYVITTGNDEGSIGHLSADKYVKGDFSDKEFVYNLARNEKVDAIVSGANDFAYLSTAYACEQLGLPGHDTYETSLRIHTKNLFREMTEELGIKTPKIRKCKTKEDCINAIDSIGFPLLVKPVDLTGGKGVKKCIEVNETLEAFFEALQITRKDYVILEKFVMGSPHGITTLIKNKKVVFHMIDNEQYGLNKYLVLGACSPSDVPQYSEYTLIKDIEKIADHCNLVDGLFHTQFILDEENYPVIIDPCRRAPGDLYILLAKYTTGIDYPLEIVNAEIGNELRNSYSVEHNFVARECIMTSRTGVIKEVHIEDALKKYLVYSHLGKSKGIKVEQPLKHKAGILIMKFPSYKIMMDVVNNFNNYAWIEFES